MFKSKINIELTDDEQIELKQLFLTDNLQKLRETCPAIIAASLLFIIYALFFQKDIVAINNIYFSGSVIFLILITANYLQLKINNIVKQNNIPVILFILILLIYCSVVGGNLYKNAGNLTLILAGLFFTSSVFTLSKKTYITLSLFCTILFLYIIYLNSNSKNEVIFALQTLLPYLLISFIIAFYTLESRRKIYKEQIKRKKILSLPVETESKEILEVLYKISNAVNNTFNLEDLLYNIHEIISSIINVKNFFVVINEEEGLKCPFFVDTYDNYTEVFEKVKINNNFSIAGHIIEKRKTMLLKKHQMVQLAIDHGEKISGKLSEVYLGIPLKLRDQVIGVMVTQDYEKSDAYSPVDIKLLISVSEQIALAIERKRNDDKLRESEKMYRMISENTNDVIIKTDKDLNFLYISPSAETFTGYPLTELYKRKFSDIVSDEEIEKINETIVEDLAIDPVNSDYTSNQKVIDLKIDFGDYSNKWIEMRYKIIRDDENGIQLLSVIRDITSRKQYEMNLIYEVNHDNLTNLHNRKAFIDELKKTIDYAKRYKEKRTILFIDLDNFKQVNDTFGHEKGDIILKEVADRLRSTLRTTDFVARIGGDEFTIILNNPDNNNEKSVMEKIQKIISAPYFMDKISIDYISASIGVSLYPNDGEDYESLIRCADTAMYNIKEEKIKQSLIET